MRLNSFLTISMCSLMSTSVNEASTPDSSSILSDNFLVTLKTLDCSSCSIWAVPMLSSNFDCSVTDLLIEVRNAMSWDTITAEE